MCLKNLKNSKNLNFLTGFSFFPLLIECFCLTVKEPELLEQLETVPLLLFTPNTAAAAAIADDP